MEKIDIDNGLAIDGLGRMSFSRHIFELLCRIDCKAGAVVGLEGQWGAGKTSVLSYLETLAEELEEADRPAIVRFNPWMVSGTSNLVSAMLKQIAPDLGRSSTGQPSELTLKILRYAQALELAKYAAPAALLVNQEFGVLFAAMSAGFTLAAEYAKKLRELFSQQEKDPKEKKTLSDIKEGIKKDLREKGRRIIVIVDDLDRLPPSEVAQMIQAVKAAADFPNVVYVLAYDPEVTANALREAISITDGASYLEKIIQLAIPLPEIPRSRLNSHARARLTGVIPRGADPAQEDTSLSLALPLTFALLESPRDIERLRTKLQVVLPVLAKKVNLADLVVLEALALKHPEIINWIDENVGWVTDLGISQFDPELASLGFNGNSLLDEADSEKKEKRKERHESWKKILKASSKKFPVEKALGFLFVNFRSQFESITRSDFHGVGKYRFWHEWRCYHDHHNSLSIYEIEGFVANPKKIIEEGVAEDAVKFRDLTQQICDVKDSGFETIDAVGMVEAFAEAEKCLGTDVVRQMDMGFGPRAALEFCIEGDQKHRFEGLNAAVELLSLWVSMGVLRDLVLPKGKNILESEPHRAESLVKRWVTKAIQAVDAPNWEGPDARYDRYSLLSTVMEFGFEEEAKLAAERFLGSGPTALAVFFSSLADAQLSEHFPFEFNGRFLPTPLELLLLIGRTKDFRSSHSRLVSVLEKSQQTSSAKSPGA